MRSCGSVCSYSLTSWHLYEFASLSQPCCEIGTIITSFSGEGIESETRGVPRATQLWRARWESNLQRLPPAAPTPWELKIADSGLLVPRNFMKENVFSHFVLFICFWKGNSHGSKFTKAHRKVYHPTESPKYPLSHPRDHQLFFVQLPRISKEIQQMNMPVLLHCEKYS